MYSFDVFDTLITRLTATPQGIFSVIQDRLLKEQKYKGISPYIRNNFAILRMNAEVFARKNYQIEDIEDITLNEIYSAFGTIGSLSEKEKELLVCLEEETEYLCSVGIPATINKVRALVRQGEKVVLISDMYLGRAAIRNMLLKADPVFEQVPLYVSSEYGKTKATGNLYWIVKKKEDAAFDDWIHYGDNSKADLAAPAKLGIRSVISTYKDLKLIESNILEKHLQNTFVQLTVGCSENTRLLYGLEKEKALGATVGAPILFLYTYWILIEAQKKGIRRLYFIARDGYILQKIADIIIKERKFPLFTKYIYGSRKAWRMASLCEENQDIRELLRWSHWNYADSMKKVAEIFELSEAELYCFLPSKYHRIKNLTPAIRDQLLRIFEDKNFVRYLIEKHKEKRNLVKEYLQENVDFSDGHFAFVELAGSGYTQICLSHIINDFYPEPIYTFFFKMDKIWQSRRCIFLNFLPGRLYQHILIEVLCHAPHGQTLKYEKIEGKITVIRETMEDEKLKKHGLSEYIEGILLFTREYLKVIESGIIDPLNLTVLLVYMDYLAKTPDTELLNFIADMPNSVTGREKEVVPYAPKLTKRDIRNIFLKRTYEPIESYYKGTSLEYSLLRSSESEKKRIEFYRKHHNDCLGNMLRFPKTIKEGKYDAACRYPIPEEMYGKKVIIYAAGNLGQAYYRQLKKVRRVKVVLWVDQNWEELRKTGLQVSAPEKIPEIKYDKVFIAVKNEKLAKSIQQYLENLGVEKEAIMSLTYDSQGK